MKITKKDKSNITFEIAGKIVQTNHREWRKAIQHAVNMLSDHREIIINVNETFVVSGDIGSDSFDSPPPASDRDALMLLYEATGGSNWTRNSGWGSEKPLGEWAGIETDENGRVTQMDLWQNNLTGTIETLPWDILDKVKYLNIKYNHLEGNIPVSLGSMSSLKTLILQGRSLREIGGTLKEPPSNSKYAYHPGKTYSNTNNFSGTIPAELGNLSNLEILEIAHAKHIKGPIPSTFGRLTNLKGLYLSGDDFRGDTLGTWVCNLTNLKQIQLSGTGIGGDIPKGFSDLTQLIMIQLGAFDHNNTFVNHLTGAIPDFSQFTELIRIVFDNNHLSGDFPHYWNNGNFTQLVTLRFTFNQLTGTLPDNFNNLPNLKSFALDSNNMTGNIDSLRTLPSDIIIMSIGWNKFSGDFPDSGWPDFSQLRTVRFTENNLTGTIPCSFWEKIDNPKLSLAQFGQNDFNNICPDGMHKVENKRDVNTGL